jgi:hypothetical protein
MRRALLLLGLTGCAYEAPLDTDRSDVPPAVVSGTVVLTGGGRPADTVLLVYDAQDPPPPVGTGAPLTFGALSRDAFEGDGMGLFEAPFQLSLPGVPEGDLLLTALVDTDGDFYPLPPFATVTGGATCGDRTGGHLADLAEGVLQPVRVVPGDRVDGITVVVGRESVFERPAFVFQGGVPTLSRQALSVGATETFRLASTGIAATLPADNGDPVPLLDLAPPGDPPGPCEVAFQVTVWDRDADGQPDEHPDFPGSGLPDAWPRIFLQYLGEVDAEGRVVPTLEEGESWAAQAALSPDIIWFGEVGLSTTQPVPTARTSLEGVFVPAAIHTLPGGREEVVTDPLALPAGAWSITVMNVAGQTWTVPNTLAGVGTADPRIYEPSGQAGALLLE